MKRKRRAAAPLRRGPAVLLGDGCLLLLVLAGTVFSFLTAFSVQIHALPLLLGCAAAALAFLGPWSLPRRWWALPLALLADDSFLTSFMTRYFEEHAITPSILVRSSQLTTIRRLIEDNTAAAFLFDQVLEESASIARLPVRDLPPVPMFLIWNAGQPLSPAARKLVRCAMEHFNPGG